VAEARFAGSAKTAISSAPASATSSLRPSAVTAVKTGEVPSPCGRSTDSVRATRSFFVSITTTWSEFASGTYARSAVGSTLIASGCERCGPTWMSLTFLPAFRSITETVPGASLLTRPVLPSRRIAAP
jgi:hypothetical protein